MNSHKNSVKQQIKDAAKILKTFTRPELYQKTYDLNSRNETARREFSYLMKMGIIKKTEKQKNGFIIYEYKDRPNPVPQNFL